MVDETLRITENISRIKAIFKIVNEAISIGESITRVFYAIRRTFIVAAKRTIFVRDSIKTFIRNKIKDYYG